MKRFGVLVTATALCVAVGMTSVASAETIRVKTRITVSFIDGSNPYAPVTQDTFAGDVKAKKGCAKNRIVKLVGTTRSDKSDVDGEYAIAAGEVPAGTYTVKAKRKKKIKANGDVKVCKAASKSIAVP